MAPTPEENKETFRRYLRAFNEGDLDAFDDLVTTGYLNHNPAYADPPRGPEGLKQVVAFLRRQAPDLRFEELHLVAEGDFLAAHVVVHGFGPEAVGQIQLERFEDGRIAEHWRATGDGS